MSAQYKLDSKDVKNWTSTSLIYVRIIGSVACRVVDKITYSEQLGDFYQHSDPYRWSSVSRSALFLRLEGTLPASTHIIPLTHQGP